MKILSVFTHPHVVPNLYEFICSAEHKGRYLEECFNQTDLIPHMGIEIWIEEDIWKNVLIKQISFPIWGLRSV